MEARLAIAAGYDVVLSNSRGPQALKDLVKELGPHARAATSAGAAAAGDLVVVSIPPRAYPAVPEKPLAGGPGHDQLHAATRRADPRAWWLALQQRGAPAAPRYGARGRGVQQDHLLDLASLARAAGAADRGALPIAGDDPAAKAAVTGFLDVIGYDTVDAGTLGSGGRRFQFGTRAFVTRYDTFSDQRGTLPAQRQTRRTRRLIETGDQRSGDCADMAAGQLPVVVSMPRYSLNSCSDREPSTRNIVVSGPTKTSAQTRAVAAVRAALATAPAADRGPVGLAS